jgi:hypothetical protein
VNKIKETKIKLMIEKNKKMEMTKQRTIRKGKKRFIFYVLGLKGIHNNR